ncbi:MAG: hypothetical protein QOJ54_2659 [Aliidongia sp.]|nr:hypothetical protein [Aliidongia sp.]
MAPMNDPKPSIKPEPLVISRRFPASRDLVFKAWSGAEHLKRWFSPDGFTVPEAEIDFRPGGVFALCMRSADGQDFWSRGTYVEIVPPERLVFTSSVVIDDQPKFSAHTIVVFAVDGTGTLMTVTQAYEIFDADFRGAVEGAPEGWRTTLDKFEREVARLSATQARGAVHATFSIERRYDAAPATVFRALCDPASKAKWFDTGNGYTVLDRAMEVRPGGRERLKAQWPDGRISIFDAVYFDIVPNERVIYAYEMTLNDQKISVSLATMELKPDGTGTRLVVTEQGAFLDGYDDGGSRQQGTGFLLDRLGASLQP